VALVLDGGVAATGTVLVLVTIVDRVIAHPSPPLIGHLPPTDCDDHRSCTRGPSPGARRACQACAALCQPENVLAKRNGAIHRAACWHVGCRVCRPAKG
jgi:hypothetical protein